MIERLRDLPRTVKGLTKVGLAMGALAASGCGTTVSFEKAQSKATGRYNRAFYHASPAGRYLIQYLRVTKIAELQHSGMDDGGVANKYEFDLGDGCLQGTAYDISGGSVTAQAEAGGLFSSSSARAEASVPTASAYAQLDREDPGKLLVRSGHANSVDLHFTNAEGPGRMVPADPATKNILKTYGCENQLNIKHTYWEIGDEAETSPYIK
jgi:hypothetical protein